MLMMRLPERATSSLNGLAKTRLRAKEMRTFWSRKCVLSSTVQKGKDVDGAKFRDYFDWSEPVGSIPSHRILAMLRGETEDVLKLKLAPPDVEAQQMLERRFVRGRGPAWEQTKQAAEVTQTSACSLPRWKLSCAVH